MTDRVERDVDLLTGAHEKRRFETELINAVQFAKANQQALSVLFVDLDELQEKSDLFGKEALELVFAKVAETISAVLDGKGPIGRMGFDELAALLPGLGATQAAELAETLRGEVEKKQYSAQGTPFSITVSIGVAALRAGEPSLNLLEAAEDACRKAKQGGRNAVVRR